MNSRKFEEWRQAAQRKAEELDAQFKVREKLNQSVNAASDAARKAGEVLNEATAAARDRASRLDEEFKVSDNLRQGARAAQQTAAEFSKEAEETAREVFGQASSYYRRAEQ